MRQWTTVLALAAGMAVAVPLTATADDAATRRKLEQLERQQREMNTEMERLRRDIQQPAKADERVGEVERRQGILTEEVRRLRDMFVLPETAELKSAYGLGPAASKVYGVQRGLSIGGYGEGNFRGIVKDAGGSDNTFDLLRFVLYVGYKFNDWIVLNTETEFEHATTEGTASSDEGSVSVEFATLDFLLHPAANVRLGLVLVPMGFVNEIHEPPFFHGNVRPPVEQTLLLTTWRSNGFGLFGEILPGLQYRTYGVTGLNAEGFESSGLREGRQSGNRELAEDWAWVGRLDYSPVTGSLLGGSAYLGNSGQGQKYDGKHPNVFTQIYELHAQYRGYGLEVRALGTLTGIDDAKRVSIEAGETIAKVMLGYYGEVAYDVLPLLAPATTQYLAPWFRYSRVDAQNSVPAGFSSDLRQDRDYYELGLTYKPIPQVALKLDYRIQDAKSGNPPDEIRVGAGLVF